jgi:hypothetical protein
MKNRVYSYIYASRRREHHPAVTMPACAPGTSTLAMGCSWAGLVAHCRALAYAQRGRGLL